MKSKIAIAIMSSVFLLGVSQVPAQGVEPALIPEFAAPISTSTGFTVQIDNYDPLYTWGGTASPSGTVNINGTGLVTFTGLANRTVTITTTRAGYDSGSETIGLCVGTTPISVNTSSQSLLAGDVLTVTFRNVGKFCGTGNFKMVTARSRAINGQGFLDYSATTQNITLDSPGINRNGNNSQTVTFTKNITSDDELNFYQFYFTNTAGAVTKTVIFAAVFPEDYQEPRVETVTAAIGDFNPSGPHYRSILENVTAVGGASYFYSWYNCGAPGSSGANAAIADPSFADSEDSSCEFIETGGSGFYRGSLTGSRPTDITNSVLVSKVDVSDVFGTTAPFYSAAVTTPTFAVTSVSRADAYVGGGETITVTGAGLTKSVIEWDPNAGVSSYLNVTTISDSEIVFTAPAPTDRSATSAIITIRTAGGDITYPTAITMTKDTIASLSNFTVSTGTLTPSFASETTTYTVAVTGTTTSLTVTPTFGGFGQTVTVNSASVASGIASSAISLSPGSNLITVVGTAEAGNTETYSITVNRFIPPTLDTPTVVAAGITGSSDSINLTWGAIANRSSYTVKIYAVFSGNLLQTINDISATTLTITTANFPDFITRTGYRFSVTAIGDGDNYGTSAESTRVAGAGGSISIAGIGGSAFEGRALSLEPLIDIPTGDGRTLSYQWLGGSDTATLTNIALSSTSATYTPKASDRSLATQMYVAVRVVATIGSDSYSYTSAAVPVYTFPNATGGSVTSSSGPRGTYTSGRYKVGQTVIGHAWSVMGTPWPTLTYQWYVCNNAAAAANVVAALAATPTPTCAAATGAGNSGTATRAGGATAYDLGGYGFSYVVTSEAAGKFLTFTATLSNEATTAQGSVFTFTQSRIMNSGIIQSTPGISGTPNISGTPQVGKRLTAATVTPTQINDNPTGKISYQWQRCTSSGSGCSNISTATRTTYTPVGGDQNKYLQVIATATNNAGDTATATSATPIQINYVIPSGLLVAVDKASAAVGETLTAIITAVTGFPEPTYIYQWQRCKTTATNCTSYNNISGATSSTYRTVNGDLNRYIRVSVRATNAAGTSASVLSSNRAGPITGP